MTAPSDTPLLPCPFDDDGLNIHNLKVRDNGRDGCGPADTWWVQCRCGAEGPNARDPAEACVLWNRRPRPPGEAGEAVEAGAMIIFGNDLAWPQMLEKNRERYREKARAVLALASPQEKI